MSHYRCKCPFCDQDGIYEVLDFNESDILPPRGWNVIGSNGYTVYASDSIEFEKGSIPGGVEHKQPICICPNCIKTIKNIFNEWHILNK